MLPTARSDTPNSQFHPSTGNGSAAGGATPNPSVESFSLKEGDKPQPKPVEKPAEKPAEAKTDEKKFKLPTNLPVEFVDLYDVLGMKRDAAVPDMRKRISELYLDAQKNLDHRNAQKKLYYQQMFEVLLPQCRHLLLDQTRRAEYDHYLDNHKEDEVQRKLAEEILAGDPQLRGRSREDGFETREEEEEQLSPEELEKRRRELWDRWQESLKGANDPLAQLKFTMPELQARAIERKEYMERALVEVHEEDRRREEERRRREEEERRRREEAERRAREAQQEARRLAQYKETMENLTLTSRLYWAFGLGGAVLLLGFSLLYTFDVIFQNRPGGYPFGSAEGFRMTVMFITVVATAFSAWRGAQIGLHRARSRAAKREQMHEQATARAAEEVTKRNPMSQSASEVKDQYELEDAIRQETVVQLRNMRRSDIIDMMVNNSSVGWAFGLGEGSFIAGFGSIVLFSSFVAKSGSRPTIVLGGLVVMIVISVAAGLFGKRYGKKFRLSNLSDH